MNQDYKFKTKIRDKNVFFRKWKVKDKKKFMNSKDDSVLMKESLVYDCIKDKKIAFSEEEFTYMLIKIREASLKDKMSYIFDCEKCQNSFKLEVLASDVITPEFNEYKNITCSSTTFEIQEIKNRKFYDESMATVTDPQEKQLIDFILHVKSINDDESLSFQEIMQFINELDVDVFEDIFKQWERMRFKLNMTHSVECPECHDENLFMFDSLPDFFPTSWEV